MIDLMERSHGNRVGLHVSGRLTEQDYRDLLPRLEGLFQTHGLLNVMFYADESFDGWDLKAAWQDTELGFRHMSDFGRLAVVGAPEWVNLCIRFSAFLFKGETRLFPRSAMEDAWDWIEAA